MVGEVSWLWVLHFMKRPPPPVHGKVFFRRISPYAKKVGSCWLRQQHHLKLCTDSKLQWHFSKQQKTPPEKFIWNLKGFQIAKIILKDSPLPDFKTYYKAIVIKAVWCWCKDRHIEIWNRMQSPEISSHIYGQLTADKSTKTFQRGKQSLFNKQ